MSTQLSKAILRKTLVTVGEQRHDSAYELLDLFFDEVEIFGTELRKAFKQKNYDELSENFHKLVGACSYFGADALQKAAAEGETLARKKEGEKLDALLTTVFKLIDDVKMQRDVVLQELFNQQK